MTRPNQESVYWDDNNKKGLDELEKRYSRQFRNALINAAMRFYRVYAKRGIDGNLQPYTLENGPNLPTCNDMGQELELIGNLVEQVLTEREKTRKRMAHPS